MAARRIPATGSEPREQVNRSAGHAFSGCFSVQG